MITTNRKTSSIIDHKSGSTLSSIKIPDVLYQSPIRPDLIHTIHTSMAKNHRQPYAVKSRRGPSAQGALRAGHQHSAKSWGTGRAVSRIPRIKGNGTNKSGQAAVGNMCRGGHMYAPTTVFRKWNRKINKKEKRYAVASALAASSVPSLVMARGHKITKVAEIPLVVDDGVESIKKTSEAIKFFEKIGAIEDIARCSKKSARKIHVGKGKMRNRRRSKKTGPLVVYNKDDGILNALRNVPGVDVCQVDALNLLDLAPGSSIGRFVIWTESAYKKLDKIFGTHKEPSKIKKNFILPRYNILHSSDINRIINTTEVQSILRPLKHTNGQYKIKKLDPLKEENIKELFKLNPYAESKFLSYVQKN